MTKEELKESLKAAFAEVLFAAEAELEMNFEANMQAYEELEKVPVMFDLRDQEITNTDLTFITGLMISYAIMQTLLRKNGINFTPQIGGERVEKAASLAGIQ